MGETLVPSALVLEVAFQKFDSKSFTLSKENNTGKCWESDNLPKALIHGIMHQGMEQQESQLQQSKSIRYLIVLVTHYDIPKAQERLTRSHGNSSMFQTSSRFVPLSIKFLSSDFTSNWNVSNSEYKNILLCRFGFQVFSLFSPEKKGLLISIYCLHS